MDKKYMKRAIELAKLGWGNTNPNPLVGAVVVKDGEVIAEGYHRCYGEQHAEVDALKKVNFNAQGATLYVNLEPCCHYGKTPPCVDAIIKSKVNKVVVAMMDPNPKVAGKGIEILRQNGIEVITGVLEEEARKLNEIFIKYITTSIPFCILKTAMTLDGKIATYTGDSKWITGDDAREYVHHIRNRVAAIMVGISTVLFDNPKLNTRILGKELDKPIRVIVDSKLRIPLDSYVVQTAKKQKTIVATINYTEKEKIKRLLDLGVEILHVEEKNQKINLKDLMNKLGKMKIDSVLLEGGGTINYSALEEGIVDKVMWFISPKIIGGKEAITSVEGIGKDSIKDAFVLEDFTIKKFRYDLLIDGYISRS